MKYIEFVNKLLKQEVSKHDELVLFGQNINAGSCLGGLTRNLKVKENSKVINSTNSENSLCGLGFGLLIGGVNSILFMKQLDFLLLGIDPIVFGLLTFFACLIPYVGAPVIYIPISAYLLLQGLTTSNYVLVIKALGMFLYGLFVISLVDNFIKPTVLSSRTDIHIGFMVLGVIGGIIFFGIIGFILGPLILVLFFSLLTIYEDMKNPGII